MILKYLNPFNVLNLIFKLFRELDHLWFYHSQIKEIKKAGTFDFYNIRVDKLRRLYTVVNMPPEFLLTSDKLELEKQEKEVLGTKLLKFQDFLIESKLVEMVKFNFRRHKTQDHYGYILIGTFKFREWKFWNLVYIAVYIWGAIKLLSLVPWDKIHSLISHWIG